jgi:hypothetical protein
VSTGPGAEEFTEQKPQFLVQLEPRIMKVAVGFEKHCARFGHLASSQTVEI